MEDKSIKILALEDSPWDMELIQKQLVDAGFNLNLTHVLNKKEYIRALEKENFEIILSDFKLPGFDAFAALELRNKICPQIPFICVSGSIGEETAIELLKQGAVDYVLKDRPERLPIAISRALEEARRAADQKKAEQDLLTSEKKHRILFETMSPGVVYQDATGKIISANPGAEKILGITFDQMRGKTTMDPRWKMITEDGEPVHGSDHPAMIALKTGKKVGPVTRGVFIPEQEKYVWLSITAIPLFRKGEKTPYQAYATFDDITKQKLSEEALFKSNRSLESFLKISQTINATMDPDQVLQMVVDNATEVMGLNSGAIYQLEDETLRLMATTPPLPENFPEQLRLANLHEHPHVKKAIATGKPVIMADTLKAKLTPAEAEIVKLRNLRSNLYLPIKTKNHTMGVLILTSMETIHEFGREEIKHIQGFANQAAHIIENARNYKDIQSYAMALENEIAERKMVEEALKSSELRFRNILQNVKTVAVQGYTMDGTVIYWNKASAEFYGYSEKEAIGKNLLELIIPAERQELVKSEIETMKKTGIPIPASEITLKRKDGSPITVYSSHSYVKVPGKDAEFFCIDTDLTEHKKAEQTRRELEVARKTAKFKQNFMAKMSHEIRTPLTGVLGMIDILEQTNLDEIQKDYLNTIKNSGENLKEIINQVLEYSKIEAGKISINPSVFKYRSLPENARQLYINCMQAGVGFHVNHDPEIPQFICADNSRLSQVLNNLVSNAVKFTSQGSVTIRSQLLSIQPDNGKLMIKIEVVDTGKGIPADLKEKLFNPFVQGKDGDSKEYEGTGLGLSICKELVKLMGGDIGVISEPGAGSTFWFSFSATVVKEEPPKEKESIVPKKQKKLRVLVTEDTIVIQKIVSLMLESLGHEVVLANNGQQALDLYEPGKFNLILMDVQMPVMDGVTATLKLKEKYKNLPPIIGLSANAFEGDREKYIALGMDEYLTKPVKQKDFLELTSRL